MKEKENETNWLIGVGFNAKGERQILSVSLSENESYIRSKILKEKNNYTFLFIEKWHGIPIQTDKNQTAVLIDVKLIWSDNFSDRRIIDEFYKRREVN